MATSRWSRKITGVTIQANVRSRTVDGKVQVHADSRIEAGGAAYSENVGKRTKPARSRRGQGGWVATLPAPAPVPGAPMPFDHATGDRGKALLDCDVAMLGRLANQQRRE